MWSSNVKDVLAFIKWLLNNCKICKGMYAIKMLKAMIVQRYG